MTQKQPKMIFLPGLGADARLFNPQRLAFPDLVVPEWIAPKKAEGLAEFAARMAETINTDGPFVLAGVSLGGMMAYEIARHIRPQALILIASCRSREGVNSFMRVAGRLWPVVPAKVFDVAKLISEPTLRIFGKLTLDQLRFCVKMFSE
ncbi:MAG: alpha/beta hydrolase, partial [Thermoguttaceae bacterium]